MHLFNSFEQTMVQNKDKVLAKDPMGSLDFKTAHAQSMAFASALSATLNKGAHVAFMLPNIKELFPVIFGTLRANMVSVPVNYLLKPEEIMNILIHGKVQLLVTRKEWGVPIETVVKAKGLGLKILYVDELEGENSLGGFLSSAKLENLPELDEDPEKMALLLFTSGTTGVPKGVMLSHKNIAHNVSGGVERISITDTDHMLAVLPFFHTFALTVNLFIPAMTGLSVSMMIKFHPRDFFKMVAEDEVTIVTMVPSMYKLLIRSRAEAKDLCKCRLFISGGEALTKPVGEAFYRKFGHVIAEGYGLTETAPIIAVNHRLSPEYIGKVGQAIGQTKIFILDENGKPLETGEIGQIAVQSPSVMMGYFENEEETQKLWVEDYFLTGDLGYLDEEGFLMISGREKDLIISAGENIYPVEIEEVVQTFPGVEECAAVGIPCEKKGESVLLAVAPAHHDTRDFRDYLREKLPAFKFPRSFLFMEELPKNQLGKVLKKDLARVHLEKQS